MIQKESNLLVADNSGARKASMIGVLFRKGRRVAQIGDIIRVNIKESAPDSAIKKGNALFYSGAEFPTLNNPIANILVAKEYGMDEAYVVTKEGKKFNAGSTIFSTIYDKRGLKFGKEYEEYSSGGSMATGGGGNQYQRQIDILKKDKKLLNAIEDYMGGTPDDAILSSYGKKTFDDYKEFIETFTDEELGDMRAEIEGGSMTKGGEIKEGQSYHIDIEFEGERLVDDVTIIESPQKTDKKVLVNSPSLQANILVNKSELKAKMAEGGEIKKIMWSGIDKRNSGKLDKLTELERYYLERQGHLWTTEYEKTAEEIRGLSNEEKKKRLVLRIGFPDVLDAYVMYDKKTDKYFHQGLVGVSSRGKFDYAVEEYEGYKGRATEGDYLKAVEQYHSEHPTDARINYDYFTWFKGSNVVIVHPEIPKLTILPSKRKKVYGVRGDGTLHEHRWYMARGGKTSGGKPLYTAGVGFAKGGGIGSRKTSGIAWIITANYI